MNLYCTICSDDIKVTDVAHATICGHLFHYHCLTQWLERSRTCPQCRNKCTERNIFRMYLMLNLNDSIKTDADSLQHDNDCLKLSIREKDLILKNKEEQINTYESNAKELKNCQKKSMNTILNLEKKLEQNNILFQTYTDQICNLNEKCKELDIVKDKLNKAVDRLTEIESANHIIKSSMSEVENTLKENISKKSLAVMVASLKRVLRENEEKRLTLFNSLKSAQNKYNECFLKKQTALDEKMELESENYKLQEKLRQITEENAELPLKEKTCTCKNVKIGEKSYSTPFKDKEHIVSILKSDSDSPYLNIVSSSVGLTHLIPNDTLKRIRTVTQHTTNNEISIIKRPRQNLSAINYANGKSLRNIEQNEKASTTEKFQFIPSTSKENSTANRVKNGKLKNFSKISSD